MTCEKCGCVLTQSSTYCLRCGTMVQSEQDRLINLAKAELAGTDSSQFSNLGKHKKDEKEEVNKEIPTKSIEKLSTKPVDKVKETRICKVCKTEPREGDMFCSRCGTRLI